MAAPAPRPYRAGIIGSPMQAGPRESLKTALRESILRNALLFLSGSLALAACVAAPSDAQGLRIERAVYSVEDRTIPCDVTTRVANACNGLAGCTVLAENALCPMGAPDPFRPKILTVTYGCGAAGPRRVDVPEGGKLVLACGQ